MHRSQKEFKITSNSAEIWKLNCFSPYTLKLNLMIHFVELYPQQLHYTSVVFFYSCQFCYYSFFPHKIKREFFHLCALKLTLKSSLLQWNYRNWNKCFECLYNLVLVAVIKKTTDPRAVLFKIQSSLTAFSRNKSFSQFTL